MGAEVVYRFKVAPGYIPPLICATAFYGTMRSSRVGGDIKFVAG